MSNCKCKRNRLVVIMSKRKAYDELSKRQKNLRLRQFLREFQLSRNDDVLEPDHEIWITDDVEKCETEQAKEENHSGNFTDSQIESEDVYESEHETSNLQSQLARWINDNNITREETGRLLKILKTADPHEIYNLPLYPATLLGTQESQEKYVSHEEFHSELATIKKMVTEILERSKGNYEPVDTSFRISFPISTPQELEEFERLLHTDQTTQEQYMNEIKQIGGMTGSKHVRNALNIVFTPEMAYKVSWTGGKNKSIMARNTKYVEILTATIQKVWRDFSTTAIHAVIKSWLQHAGDRLPKNTRNSNDG